ncbi:MAG: zinc ribbon domain-containing protein [Clostridia bacterium]|nr:zinc ribbon domain-containing protein [Clostridia bacterium]
MFCPECGAKNEPNAKYCMNCGYTLTESAVSEQKIAPAVDAAVYGNREPNQAKPKVKRKNGCLIALMVLAVLLALFAVILVLGGGFSFTTARFSDVELASEIDGYEASVKTDVFNVNSPEIFIVGELKNAPDGTVIGCEWYYLGTNPATLIDFTNLVPNETNAVFRFSLSRPYDGWPSGDYAAVLYIDDNEKMTLEFSVR